MMRLILKVLTVKGETGHHSNSPHLLGIGGDVQLSSGFRDLLRRGPDFGGHGGLKSGEDLLHAAGHVTAKKDFFR